jgi:GNAT superfamily N-acetyltransferase
VTGPLPIDATLAKPEDVLALRDLYRQEMNCQIILDSWHSRGWTDSYLLRVNGRIVGYASVGGVRGNPKDTVTEFFVLPVHRAAALSLFRRLVAVSQAQNIEVQTNDRLLTLMLFDCSSRYQSETILFHDAFTTNLIAPDVCFRRVAEGDQGRVFPHMREPVGDWILDAGGEVIATGGILFHYNPPYGDIYMEVAEPSRRRGYGSYLVQELKRTCYEMGRIPAARCNANNPASRATLQKAGFLPCARVLTGEIAVPTDAPIGH